MIEPIFRSIAAALAVCSLAHAGIASGQAQFPSKPHRFIAMGTGFPENTARVLGAEMFGLTGQRVIVEARPGANGILAAEYVARAAPDGYTILIGTNSTHAANQSLFKKLPYDYVKDFIPVSGISRGMVLAVVHPQVPAKSIKELTALAKKSPDMLTFGSGSSVSLAAVELYKLLAGIKIRNIPYKTVPQASIDLVAGRVDMMMANLVVVMPHVNAGKLRALAISGTQRWPTLPDVPTMHEAGVRGYEWAFWNAAWLPAGTPNEIVARANELFVTVLGRPKVKEYMLNAGSIPFPTTSGELMRFQLAEHDKWRKVIRAAGIQAE
ncbi:MAG: tripartite tricarboxylate transporter substrate binding protein [Betaproteobacteria bacterium]|nr:tripartite tricarboxylate transporter substrate binding protein [Betaproteobacteria bacterium]